MSCVYYLKAREGSYFDEQMDNLFKFIDQVGYKKICFLMDAINKMNDRHVLGKAIIRYWGKDRFKTFKKNRYVKVGSDNQFIYGTVKTLGYDLDKCDVVIHVYAYSTDFYKAFQYTYNPDHILLYWNSDQPDLDEWVAILHGKNIGPTEDIQPVSLDLPEDVRYELSRIKSVNVSDGGTHPMDEQLMKEVAQNIRKAGHSINTATFKAFLIHEIKFKPHHAENAANKVKRFL